MKHEPVTTSTPVPSLWFGTLTSAGDQDHVGRAIVSGSGCVVRDASGREYLDARSALWNASLGYGNRHVIDAMIAQLNTLPVAQLIRHDQPHRIALEYAERLVAVLPANLRQVRFCTTGSQAIEGAVMLSRFVRRQSGEPARTDVIALWNSYHGIGGLASAVTGEQPLHDVQGQLAPGVHHVPAGDLDALRTMVDSVGAGRITAVVMEPVLGTDVVELSAAYLHQVQQLCQSTGIHVILDEVTTGFGRTGSLTAAARLGLAPDMLVLSKGITAGYAPLAAIAVTAKVFRQAVDTAGPLFPHGSTSDGHPLAIAAAAAVLDELADGQILDNVAARGAQLTTAIQSLAGSLDAIRGVHGPGLMLAVPLADPAGRPLTAVAMSSVKDACRDAGLLLSTSNDMVVLTPPLVISASEVDVLVSRFERGVRAAVGDAEQSRSPTRRAGLSPVRAT